MQHPTFMGPLSYRASSTVPEPSASPRLRPIRVLTSSASPFPPSTTERLSHHRPSGPVLPTLSIHRYLFKVHRNPETLVGTHRNLPLVRGRAREERKFNRCGTNIPPNCTLIPPIIQPEQTAQQAFPPNQTKQAYPLGRPPQLGWTYLHTGPKTSASREQTHE